MSTIRYFRATAADLEVVVDMRIEVLLIFQGRQTPQAIAELRPHLREYLKQALKDGTYICWLAEADGRIIGSGGMSLRRHPGNFSNPSGRVGYIMSMYTLPEQRGKGICSELVRRLTDTGRSLGITHFELHATKSGEPVYQKLGFVLHEEPTYRKRI